MKPLPVLTTTVLLACGAHSDGAGAGGVMLSRGREAFLVEDDLVYARCFDLRGDGTYRQINRDEHGSEEVDRGTWEQSAGGTLRLHSTRHALRFRALVSGPVSVALNNQAARDALPALHDAVQVFLAASADAVFSAREVAGIAATPGLLDVSSQAETCSRQDLATLARQIADFLRTERSGVYLLQPPKTAADPPVFVLAGDTFQAADLPQVRRDYHVPTGGRPPFYFVPVGARVFAREVGSWRAPRLAGSPE